MKLGRRPQRTGDLRTDSIGELRWATAGPGLTIEKLVAMESVLRLPRIVAALDGIDAAVTPKVALETLVAVARGLGESPHARILRNALAIDYSGAGKDLTARREEFVRAHNDAVRAAGDRNVLPETTRAIYTIEQHLIEALVTDLGAPPGTRMPAPERRAAAALPVPRQLPAATWLFTGRADALDWLDGTVAGTPHAPAVVVIHGQPGVGKTALALQWAHRVAPDFPDGQLWLDLRGHSREGGPLSAVAAISQILIALGVAPESLPGDAEQLSGLYRSVTAGKRLLVALDNAASTDQVSLLVPGDPSSVVLVTSRNALPALTVGYGARVVTLDALPPDEATALLGALVGADRAGADPSATVDLAARCGFLPLALRIVAAKLLSERHTTVADMARRLSETDRLTALEVGDDGEVAVRAAFELSYFSLSAEEQRAFRLLGLVPGSTVTDQAVARLLDVEPADARRLLGRLVACHLVFERASRRYEVHDLLRDYASALCRMVDDAETRHAATARLLAHYVHRAVAATTAVHPRSLRLPHDEPLDDAPEPLFADRDAAIAWLTAEQANLGAAVVHAASHGNPTAAWQLAYAMRGLFVVRPCGVEWLALGEAGLGAATDDGHLYAVSAMHGLLGRAYRQLGDLEIASGHVREALAAGKDAAWAAGQVIAHCTLGGILQDQARLDEAIEHHRAALAIDRGSGRPDTGATHLANIGAALFLSGDLAGADEHCGAALEIMRRTGDERGVAVTLECRGAVRRLRARLDEAAADLETALGICRRDGIHDVAAQCLSTFARVRADLGALAEARRYANDARRLARTLDDVRTEVDAVNAVGAVALRGGQPARATRAYRDALALATRVGYRYGSVSALVGAATSAVATGPPDEAQARGDEAVRAAHDTGFRVLEAYALAALSRAQLALGDRTTAAATCHRATDLFEATGCVLSP